MRYSVTDDKRNIVENILYVISCVICVVIEVFILSKIRIDNEFWNMILNVIKCVFAVSPVLFVWIFKKIFYKWIFKAINIKNLTGTYKVSIHSNYKRVENSTATIEIKQDFDKINIYFKAKNSSSVAINAKIDNSNIPTILYYSYKNEGSLDDSKNKMHIGTAVLTFKDNKIEGFYYNNGRERQTYGSIVSE